MGRWSWVRISRPPWKRVLKKSVFPHVKNLANHSPWVPEIVKNFGVGTYGPIRRPRIPLFKGGESVIRLSLRRRLVNLSPVAKRTDAFTAAPQTTIEPLIFSTIEVCITVLTHNVVPEVCPWDYLNGRNSVNSYFSQFCLFFSEWYTFKIDTRFVQDTHTNRFELLSRFGDFLVFV